MNLWTNGCSFIEDVIDLSPTLSQIADRRDQERKAFSRMFQPSGGSEKIDEVLF